jgi:tRNA (uracil-5-)-methyltransferase
MILRSIAVVIVQAPGHELSGHVKAVPVPVRRQVRAVRCRGRLKDLPGALEVHIIGRSKGSKIVLEQDYVVETQVVHGRSYSQMQPEDTFSQPNGVVCQKMVSWASRVVQESPGDCLELYCGNGNFTVPMAQHFRRVVATEVLSKLRLQKPDNEGNVATE